LIWIQYANSRKEIRNQKRKRRKENKNIKLGLREPFRPRRGTSPRPRKNNPNRYLYFSLASLTCGSQLSDWVSFFFLALISPVTVSSAVTPLPEIISR
jgi:hypothetical protein